MKKSLAAMTILALVAVLAAGCAGVPQSIPTPTSPIPTPAPTPTGEEINFRLLISDEVNAITDFDELWVEVTGIGVHQAGEDGGWIEPPDFEATERNLRELMDSNATELWSGFLEPGVYNKVFIYVETITGVPEANVKLPSNKLQISKPFTIGEDEDLVDFVYDITVVKAGNSGKYILKPQIGQSGAGIPFNEVPAGEAERHQERHTEKHGKPENQGELNLEIVEGDIAPGESITLLVTFEDEPVAEAAVTINGEELDLETDSDGYITLSLPDKPGKVKIMATLEDKSGEIEIKLKWREETYEWFEGTITAVTEGTENASPWTMTLEGVEGDVTVYVTELEGTPSVGARAEVEGVLTDSIIEDATAEIEEED